MTRSETEHQKTVRKTSGDAPLLEELLAEHRHRLYRYIYNLVANGSDAEDICQRACLVMWTKFASFDPSRNFLPWAFGIAFLKFKTFAALRGAERLIFSSETIDALATGIDLSELGYAPGESVARQMLHDTFRDGQAVDPVLIVGLP